MYFIRYERTKAESKEQLKIAREGGASEAQGIAHDHAEVLYAKQAFLKQGDPTLFFAVYSGKQILHKGIEKIFVPDAVLSIESYEQIQTSLAGGKTRERAYSARQEKSTPKAAQRKPQAKKRRPIRVTKSLKKALIGIAASVALFGSGYVTGQMNVPTFTTPADYTVTVGPPTLFDVNHTAQTVYVTWTQATDATGYQLAYRVVGVTGWKYADFGKSTFGHVIDSPYLGHTIDVFIRARYNASYGSWSQPLDVEPYTQWFVIGMMAKADTFRIQSEGGGYAYDGSGFAVPGGYILTCDHVIDNGGQGAYPIQVESPGSSGWHSAQLVAYSKRDDLALLYAPNASVIETLPGGNQYPTHNNQPVAFSGFPLGGAFTFQNQNSVIIQSGQSITPEGYGNLRNMMSFFGHVVPGDSGGPVLNHHGQVVGVIESTQLPASQYNNENDLSFGFAIPLWKIERFLLHAEPAQNRSLLLNGGY